MFLVTISTVFHTFDTQGQVVVDDVTGPAR